MKKSGFSHMGLSMVLGESTTWAAHVAAAHLGAVALEHGHPQALLHRGLAQYLAQAHHALAAEAAGHYLQSVFHSAPVLLILFTEAQTCSLNSGREPVASCQTPVAHTVFSSASSRGLARSLIHR